MVTDAPLALGWRRVSVLFASIACFALALAVTTRADSTTPVVDLGPVIVANGIATVSGHIADQTFAGTLTVNGQPVAVDSSGQFSAAVNLNGQSSLSLSTHDPATGQTVTTTIPLSLAGTGGVIPATTVLDQLKSAGVSVTIPPGGLTSLDGQPVTLSGSVSNPSKLGSLTVNGQDVLGQLGPEGSFSQQLPVGTKEVTIRRPIARVSPRQRLSASGLRPRRFRPRRGPLSAPPAHSASALRPCAMSYAACRRRSASR